MEQQQQCDCSSCDGTLEDDSYCCSTIEVAKDLTRRGSVDCITDIKRFKKSICEESVLELIAYSVNRKNFAEKEDIKNGIVSSVLQHTEHFSEF